MAPPAVLAVWGAWAITAGIVQLVVAVGRRALGGQWPMIISGGVSVLAGTGFFLVPALRLQRRARAGR